MFIDYSIKITKCDDLLHKLANVQNFFDMIRDYNPSMSNKVKRFFFQLSNSTFCIIMQVNPNIVNDSKVKPK